MGITLNQNLTELALPQGVTSKFWWDDALRGFGLLLRIDAGGKLRRSWVVQYRGDGYQRRRKLGDAAKLTADVARKKALAMLGKVAEGVDPVGNRDAQRAAALTFATAAAQYLQTSALTVRTTTQRLNTLYLTRPQYFGTLHKLPLAKITQSHVSTALDSILLNSGRASARQARRHLSAFFVHCMKRGHCAVNPANNTEAYAPTPGGRQRVLKDTEIAEIWRACDGVDDFHRIVRLLILTAARRSEIGGLKWNEVDLDAGVINLPGARVKNHYDHQLPITAGMAEIIKSVPHMVGREHLFGARSGEGFTVWLLAKSALDKRLNLADWNLHDLRRSVATWLAEHGDVDPHVVEALLNHHKGGVASIYNKARYARPIRIALNLWNDHLRALVAGSARKVIPLRA